jgi:hypothetical protein
MRIVYLKSNVLTHRAHGYFLLTQRPFHNRYYLNTHYLIVNNSIVNFLKPGTKLAENVPIQTLRSPMWSTICNWRIFSLLLIKLNALSFAPNLNYAFSLFSTEHSIIALQSEWLGFEFQ